MRISEIVAKAEDMFDAFNLHFYDGELDMPAVTVSSDNGTGAYGWCSAGEIWQYQGRSYRELNISAEYLCRSIDEVAVTLLHEMAHLYDMLEGIQDVNEGGFYHNAQFKRTAETHGLIVKRHSVYGWTLASLTPDSALWLHCQPDMTGFTARRIPPVPAPDRANGSGRVASRVKVACGVLS